MLSENHREKFSINLLHKTYEPESTVNDLISFFEPYEIEFQTRKIVPQFIVVYFIQKM